MRLSRPLPRSIATAVIVGLVLQGCATPPDSVGMTYTSPLKYQDYTCKQIGAELDRVGQQVADMTGRQRRQATKDAWAFGVGLVLFWPALFFMIGEDKKEELAALKGEYDALQKVAVQKECGFDVKPPVQEAANTTAAPAAQTPALPGKKARAGATAFPE